MSSATAKVRMRRLDNIDLRLLRVFATLADAGGFADAQISAQPVRNRPSSTHLAALERKLGGQLCERGRGGFRLTAFGESTHAAAKQPVRGRRRLPEPGRPAIASASSAASGSASSMAS